MILPWRNVRLGGGYFDTSLTNDEAEMLRSLTVDASVLEIGTAYGYAACVMAKRARLVITVDPHHGYGSMPGSLITAASNIRTVGVEDRVVMAVADSHSFLPKLIAAGAKFDMVFIDGDHRYGSVMSDLDNASWLLRPNGVLAVHDYGEETCPDVKRAVQDRFGAVTAQQWAELTDTLWVARQ